MLERHQQKAHRPSGQGSLRHPPELLLSTAFSTRKRNDGAPAASDAVCTGPPPWMDSGPLLGIDGIVAQGRLQARRLR